MKLRTRIVIVIKLMCEFFHSFILINNWRNDLTKVVAVEPARHISHFQLLKKNIKQIRNGMKFRTVIAIVIKLMCEFFHGFLSMNNWRKDVAKVGGIDATLAPFPTTFKAVTE